MKTSYSDQQLQAFLDEALAPEAMAQIEVQMRTDAQLMNRLMSILGQREAGVHGLVRSGAAIVCHVQRGNNWVDICWEHWTKDGNSTSSFMSNRWLVACARPTSKISSQRLSNCKLLRQPKRAAANTFKAALATCQTRRTEVA